MKGSTMNADPCFYSFPVRFFMERIPKGEVSKWCAQDRSGTLLAEIAPDEP